MGFDENSNLVPYSAIEISLADFQLHFGNSPKRQSLLQTYLEYMEEFRQVVTGDFFQYINGSFVTKKSNPKDIDLVNFVDHEIHALHESDLKRLKGNQKFKGIDAYLEKTYPTEHPFFIRYQTDLLYWDSLFTKDRSGRKKGYLKLNFGHGTTQ